MQETQGHSLGKQRGWLHREPCYWSGIRSCSSVTPASTINLQSPNEAWAISAPPPLSPRRSWLRACGRHLGSSTLDNQEKVASAALSWHTVVQVRLWRTPQGICRHVVKASCFSHRDNTQKEQQPTSERLCAFGSVETRLQNSSSLFILHVSCKFHSIVDWNNWCPHLSFKMFFFFFFKVWNRIIKNQRTERFVNLQKSPCNLFCLSGSARSFCCIYFGLFSSNAHENTIVGGKKQHFCLKTSNNGQLDYQKKYSQWTKLPQIHIQPGLKKNQKDPCGC